MAASISARHLPLELLPLPSLDPAAHSLALFRLKGCELAPAIAKAA